MPNEWTCCPRCQGRGLVELQPFLASTLEWLRQSGPATVREAHRGMGLTGTTSAMNNRLEDLRALGLVTRPRKRGKQYVYEALPPLPAPPAPTAAAAAPAAAPCASAAGGTPGTEDPSPSAAAGGG